MNERPFQNVGPTEQQWRLLRLLGPFVEDDDRDLSDSEFIYRLKKRFDLDWNKRQTLVDVSE